MNVNDYLNQQSVEFDRIPHRDTYAAQRLAQALHTPGGDVAKTVLLKADQGYQYLVAVLPATKSVDFEKVSANFGGSQIELALEREIKEHCSDCEVGALPPFGSQYGMKTLVDDSLLDHETVVFEGNSHHEAIRMRFEDFRRIEQPLVISFAV